MPEYRRNFVKGGSNFFTVALADRSQHLLVDHIDALREAFRYVKTAYPFHLDAMVILPEHLHCIWTLPAGDANYPAAGGASRQHFRAACPSYHFGEVSTEWWVSLCSTHPTTSV